MSKLKRLFGSVWFKQTHLSKKMYTTGLIIFSGTVAVAVVMLGVNGFAGTKHVDHVLAFESEEEDQSEQQVIETLITVEQAEESPSRTTANVIEHEIIVETKKSGMKLTVHDSNESSQTMTLMREESSERNLRTNANTIEDEELTLISLEDYTALVRIVEAEATGEDLIGKILIANVVLNRVESGRFPNSIYNVVHQKLNGRAQFSPIDDGRYYSVKITDSTIEAVESALSGTDYSEGALFFVAKSIASENAGSWFDRNLNFVFKHGVHSFYKY